MATSPSESSTGSQSAKQTEQSTEVASISASEAIGETGICDPHAVHHSEGPQDNEEPSRDAPCKMHKFCLYETTSRYYLVGSDAIDCKYRILKIDRTSGSGELSIADDDIVYSKTELHAMLGAIDDGNRSSGGLKIRMSTWGLLGFIRFTGEYYMLLVTKRSSVAMIGGHYIYQIDGTELVSLSTPASKVKADRHPEEARFVGILNNLDLTRSFYFSHSYDITNTLQCNIQWERHCLSQPSMQHRKKLNEMFIWNHYLLQSACETLRHPYDWCTPVIHGFVDQASEFFWQDLSSSWY